jgi:penicillin-binding protein 2
MRYRILFGFFALVWIALLVRVFNLSVQSNEHYESLSQENSIKSELSAPVRGEILDRNGEPIAINELGFKIALAPHLTRGKDTHLLDEQIVYLMSVIPTLDGQKMAKLYKQSDSYYNHTFIDVVDFVPHETMIPLYSLMNLRPQIQISPSPKRLYPHGSIAAHLIGYVAKANEKESSASPLVKLLAHTGKGGVEKYYNAYLQGEAGERRIKVNAHNVEIEELARSAIKENRNLTLNIDMRLQEYLTTLFQGKVGAVVVMDTRGAIYASGSYPEYDLNSFVEGVSSKEWNYLMNSVDAPFTNKLTNGLYPPGSTIKIGMGLVYITSGKMDENTIIQSTGSMKLGGRTFRDWKKTGHGATSITKAIKESCDDYFYQGSLKVGIDAMSRGLTRMGMGTKTGIDLPNEFIGTVPSREWKKKRFKQPWFHGETLNTSIGQGDFLASPLQIAQLTALIATGKLPVPHVAQAMGSIPYAPPPRDVLTALEKQKLPYIQQGMVAVCNEKGGTATGHIHTPFPIAGKTGTAQTTGISQTVKNRENEKTMAYLHRSHAWFTSYGPAYRPQFIVTILIEHGGHGGEVAGEMASSIYNKLYQLGYIQLGAIPTPAIPSH